MNNNGDSDIVKIMLVMVISTVCILLWKILRKRPKDQIKTECITWILAWLGYFVLDLIIDSLNLNVLEYKIYGAFIVAVLYSCIVIYLTIKFKWSSKKQSLIILNIFTPLIGYCFSFSSTFPLYVSLLVFACFAIPVNLLCKYRFDL